MFAILALSWGSAAAATKVTRETGTLEYEVCKAPKVVKVLHEFWQAIFSLKLDLGLSCSRRSNIGVRATSTICALVVTVSAACRYIQF